MDFGKEFKMKCSTLNHKEKKHFRDYFFVIFFLKVLKIF